MAEQNTYLLIAITHATFITSILVHHVVIIILESIDAPDNTYLTVTAQQYVALEVFPGKYLYTHSKNGDRSLKSTLEPVQ